ncbi:hypothetical protein M3F56_00370 [Cutibacterium avidum]|uniref:hypothetical protein n=1 Tax=Cutibacterium avidum TaxID=33010 RepID=UPI000798A397|nr:hypothetical protein [Cutibacterium avidum]KXA67536.1 D5 like protein [Cutibacterium avidum]MCT1415327.1 hypothetical protein [Cutibacterium avidum]MCX8467052.1 hypothetical protein [Cutibacterium avidum]MCX8469398.1 hypothetical protein [Cutibacterium avidum]MDK7699086.1 hypothetical protein [Cutibacterium avidum]
MTPFILCAATGSGNAHNNYYPNRHTVTDAASLSGVAGLDHVAATYVNDRRSTAAFIASDCVVMDIDNDHTDNPADWITPEKLAELMAGVVFMTVTSRNHQKPKGVLSARPRFHVYFPITEMTDADTYAGLKRRLASRFAFFDRNALDAGRFIYGTPNPQVTVHEGDQLLDAWLDAADEIDVFAAFDASTLVIGEGSRNATLSRFAGRVLIRYGETDQARDLFDRKANLCEPPLSDNELATIWNSACRFASKVAADPGYLPPEAYEALAGLRPDDFSDVGQADILAGEYANKIRYSLATKWLVYDHGVWDENDLSAQGVVQELTSRQLEEADRLIASTWETMTATGADLVMASASSKARGIAKLTPVQASAFRAWDEAKNYHKFVLSRRLSRNITATLKEAGPILQVRVRDLDVDPYLLNTPTGTWDLRDGSSHEHNPRSIDQADRCRAQR